MRIWFFTAVLFLSVSSTFASTPKDTSQEFAFGFYAVSKGYIPLVKKLGLNYVHNYGVFAGSQRSPVVTSIKDRLAYMDEAHKHGLKVMVGLPSYQIKYGQFDKIREFIKAAKDHPALGRWYLFDEPCLHTDVPRENLVKTYKMLKKMTPDVPVICAETWGKNWKKTVEICDVLLPDFYPVKAQPYPVANLALVYRFTQLASRLGKPIMVAGQSMTYEMGTAKTPEEKAKYRFPSPVEQRFTFYSSLVQGGNGLYVVLARPGANGRPAIFHSGFAATRERNVTVY